MRRRVPIPLTDKAKALLTPEAKALLARLIPELGKAVDWSAAGLEALVRAFVDAQQVKLGQVAQPLRAALAGSTTSPGIFEVMEILGQSECLGRIGDCT